MKKQAKSLSFKTIKKIYHEEIKPELPVVEEKVEQQEVLSEPAPVVEEIVVEPVKVVQGNEALVDEFLAAIGAKDLVEVVVTPPQPKINIEPSAFVDINKLDDFLKSIEEEAVPPAPPIEQIAKETPLSKAVVNLTKPKKSSKPQLDPNIKAIHDRLNIFEKRLSDVSMFPGQDPGGGETKFRFLDDVDRNTIGDTEHVLRYDPVTKKFFFGQLVGDHGEVNSLTFADSGPGVAATPRMIAWNNSEDCLDVFHADGTIMQAGLDQYIQIHNHAATTLTNGTVVKFAGVEEPNGDPDNPMPITGLFSANSASTPLYLIGVVTRDIAPSGVGRATVFGKVRNLNTTGSAVGETWERGDLLWGHPTMPGKLTKVKPTSPDVVTSIAAVLKVGTTDGVILVRPTIFPRLFYGDWYSTVTQTVPAINTPIRVTVNNQGIVSGFTNDNGLITAQNSGSYNFQFSLQIISSNSSAAYYWIWYRKNGVDVSNSATKLSISSNSTILAPSWNFPVSMQPGDTFELMWACDSTNVSIAAYPKTAFCPEIPSVLLTVQQVNL